jgi:FkbM family methyltransferase
MRCKWAAACGEAAAARFISENHLTPLEVQFSRLRTSEPDFLKKSPPDFAKDSVKLPDPLPVLTEENPNPKRALLSPPASRNAAIPESALPSATNHFEDSERRGLQKDLEDTLRAIMRSLRRKLGWRFRLPIEFIQHRLRIARGPLSVALKKRTLLTQATLYTRRLFSNNHRETQSRILGFQVAAYSLETLAFLYREIFIDLDYYFETDEPAPYIIDCGSNIGMSILFFKAMYPHATIVGFEPATDSFAMLRRNIEVNQIQDVVVHPFAVGDAARRVNFFQKGLPGALVASTKIQRVSERSYTVDQVCLSDFIDREVDFLKLDVEGAEAAVLSNLATTGTLRHVRQMAVEYHHHIEANDDCLAEFLAQLEGHGFGYQIRAAFGPAKRRGQFQDFLLYAYRKEHVARSGSQSSDSSGHFKQTEHFSSVVSRK